MNKITFTVPGKPRGKQRPRSSRLSGTMYTPRETLEYEKLVALSYKAKGGRMMEGLVAVDIVAEFRPPESLSAKKKIELLRVRYANKKPDGDNVAKIVMDGLQGVAYKDDKDVVHHSVDKFYGETDRVTVTIWELDV